MTSTDASFPWTHAHATWLQAAAWIAGGLTLLASLAPLWAPASRSADTNPDAAPSVFERWRRRLAAPLLFVLVSFIAVQLHRWPVAVAPSMQNPDEAQMIAGAITLRYSPVFWKSVDGTTAGPLSDYVLMWPWLFGEAPGLATARVTGVALLTGALLFGWAVLRRVTGEPIARLATLTGLIWLAFLRHWEFAQYTSEQLAVFLLAAATWQFTRLHFSPPSTKRGELTGWALAGFTLSTLFLAKLQSAPAAAVLVVVALSVRWKTQPLPTVFARAVLALGAGAGVFAILLLGYLQIWGLLAQFRFAYLDSNLHYAGAGAGSLPLRELVSQMLGFRHEIPAFNDFLCALGLPAVIAFAAWRWLPRERRPVLLAALGVAIGGAWSVLGPGRVFGHYLQFFFAPLVLLGGVALSCVSDLCQRTPWPRAARGMLAGVFIAIAVLPPLVRHLPRARVDYQTPTVISYTDPITAGRVAARLTLRGEPLVIWGWAPGIYVAAERPHGVREAHTEHQITPGPLREAFRERFIRDFRRSQAPLFIDAVGGDNFAYAEATRVWAGHETWPELAAYVAGNYTLVTEVRGSRMYVRRDLAVARAALLPPSPTP